MFKVAQFITWVGRQSGRIGAKRAKAAINWIRKHPGTVLKWIERGTTYGTILEMVLRAAGIG